MIAISPDSLLSSKILKATLELILQQGWLSLNLNDIARYAGIPLSELYALYPHKFDILDKFFKEMNQKMLANLEQFNEDEISKHRLFSVIMTRLDVLLEHKEVLAKLWQEAWTDPCLFKQLLSLGEKTAFWLLQAADMDTTGVIGQLRLKTFGLFYLSVIRTWLKDHSPDMSSTMAYVDQGINRLNQIPGFF